MKTIGQIYDEYTIMPNLQEHQLRVASVAQIICDSFTQPVTTSAVVRACLFHDMGNIIKADLPRFPEFMKEKGIEFWQKTKDDYIQKYGPDEHAATLTITQEIGLPEEVQKLIQRIGFSNLDINEKTGSYENKICSYADMRVGPHGVLTIEERLSEARKRYEGRPHTVASDRFEPLANSLRAIEKELFTIATVRPEEITDQAIAPIMEELKKLSI
jgi:hypothetical protein